MPIAWSFLSDNTESNASLIAPFATTATLALVLTASKIVLWRARLYAKYLEEEASRVWSNNGPLLDISDIELHQSLIQTSLNRGANTVRTLPTNSGADYLPSKVTLTYKNDSAVFWQRNSSSEVTSNGDRKHTDLVENASIKYNKNQVGGMSIHKMPVLTLEPNFILKPLRLPVCDSSGAEYVSLSKHIIKASINVDTHDKTKLHRGLREVAFYESLHIASSLTLDGVAAELKSLMNDNVGSSYSSSLSLIRLYYLLTTDFTLMSRGYNSARTMVPERNQVFNMLCLLAAYQAGDPSTLVTIRSCATSRYRFMKEQIDLKSFAEFTAQYAGVIDIPKSDYHDCVLTSGCEKPNDVSRSLTTKPIQLQQPYLILKDITSQFKHPNIIDIKIGTQTYEPDAPDSKQKREIKKYPLQSEFGFRIVGMRVYDTYNNTYKYWNKSFGKNLSCRNDIKRVLRLFFRCNDDVQPQKSDIDVLSRIISQLTTMQQWLKYNNTTLAFYASSILMVYEGGPHICNDETFSANPMLKMIDFTHVCRRDGGDFGCLKGVETLLDILSEIIHDLDPQRYIIAL